MGNAGVNAVERLRGLGCKVAMNGYLTEGMSISLLNAVDMVKLGAEACAGIADRPSDVGLLRAAVEFAHRAGVKVVAECIENERDAAVLAEAGVDYLQGYLYGQAAPEHFNLKLAPMDAARTGHCEVQAERAQLPSHSADAEAMLPELTDTEAAQNIAVTAALPAIPENGDVPYSRAALLDSPDMDLLKAALGKLEEI